MLTRLLVLPETLFSLLKSRRQLALENLVLRQQVAMLRQSVKRPRVSWFDRVFWVLFAQYVERWRTMLHALHPRSIFQKAQVVVEIHSESLNKILQDSARRKFQGHLPITWG